MSDDCPIEKLLPELKIHERECKYRIVTCPNFECGDKVTFDGLLDHIKNGHILVEKFNEFPIAKKIKLTFNKTNPQPKLFFGKVSLNFIQNNYLPIYFLNSYMFLLFHSKSINGFFQNVVIWYQWTW